MAITNEQKANILSYEIAQEFDSKEMVGYECAIQMAEWKEQQMIKKAVKFIRDKNKNGGFLFDKNWEEDFVKTIKEK